MTSTSIVDLNEDWRLGDGRLYSRLASALGRQIAQGALAAFTTLPPERSVAKQLRVSRTTVVAAYQVLRRQGLLETRRGSGTWVTAAQPRDAEDAMNANASLDSSRSPELVNLSKQDASTISFAMANLPALDLVSQTLSSLHDDPEMARCLRTHGYVGCGLPKLRQTIAAHYGNQGLPSTQEQILVTTGAQQAISLVASLFVSHGDTVIVEDPTYSGAIDAFRTAGARLVVVPFDSDGSLCIDVLRTLAMRTRPRLIYVVPVHNPTGAIMDDDVKREIAHLSTSLGVPVLEDLTLSHVTLAGGPSSAIAVHDQSADVISVESVSKVLWGGLRVGWIRAQASTAQQLSRAKAAADLGSPLVSQIVATRLLPQMPEIENRVRERASPRLELLTRLLSNLLPEWRWNRPMGGLSLWVRIPRGSATDFCKTALDHGVRVVAGPTLSPDGHHDDHLRIAYVLDQEQTEQGVRRLADAWKAYQSVANSTRFAVVV